LPNKGLSARFERVEISVSSGARVYHMHRTEPNPVNPVVAIGDLGGAARWMS